MLMQVLLNVNPKSFIDAGMPAEWAAGVCVQLASVNQMLQSVLCQVPCNLGPFVAHGLLHLRQPEGAVILCICAKKLMHLNLQL